MKRLCVVLLAAGCSSRYGRPKLLESYGGVSLIRRAAGAAIATDAALLVVTGAYAEQIGAALQGVEARLVHNAAWDEGMGTSIATAFQYLLAEAAEVEAAIVCPADLPLVGAAQLQRLIDAYRAMPQRIVVSGWGEAQGPPCLFPRRCFDELAQLRGPQGARALLVQHAAELERVTMPEAAVDIDTVEDYVRLQSAHGLR